MFTVVAKVSGFQAHLELTVWYTQVLTLRGYGEVIVKLPRYFVLQSIRLPRLAQPTTYDEIVQPRLF